MKVAKVFPAVNQIQHNVFAHDDDTLDFAAAHNITIEAYSPLGRTRHEVFVNPTIAGIARSRNVSNAQVALRWILQHGHVLAFQSSSKVHQAQDADLFGFALNDKEMAMLDHLQAGLSRVLV